MVQAQLHLYLNKQGRKEFVNWLRFFGKVARQFTGFINIQLLQVEGSNSLGLVLIFETKEQVELFFESPVFNQLMNRMKPHTVKPYQKVILRAKNLYTYKGKKPTEPPKASAIKVPLQSKKTTQETTRQEKPSQEKPMQETASEAEPEAASETGQDTSEPTKVIGMAEFMATRNK